VSNKQAPLKKSVYKSTVPAVDQALRLLQCLAENKNSKMTLTEICDQLKIHKSKGYTLLNTLRKYDFVRKDPRTKTYSLWLGIAKIARKAVNNLDIRDLAEPLLAELVEETNNAVHLGIISDDRFYIVARSEGLSRMGFMLRLYNQLHVTHGAHGKAIVAFMSEEERQRILSEEWLAFYGDGEPVDREYLEEEMMLCRKIGYAQDPGETNPGLNAVSAPIFNSDNQVYGAVVLLGTFPRSHIKLNGPKVAKTAKKISQMLGADIE